MQVFLYDAAYAKAHKCTLNPWKVVGGAFGYTLLLMAFIFLLIELGWDTPFVMLLVLVGFVVSIVVWALHMQVPSQATTTAYVLDAEGLLWQVYLYPRYIGTSAYDLAIAYYAQAGQPMPPTLAGKYAYFVQCAKQGVFHWNAWWGGEAKATPLYGLQPVSEGKKAYHFTYTNAKGKVKKLTLLKAYPTLFRHFWGERFC